MPYLPATLGRDMPNNGKERGMFSYPHHTPRLALPHWLHPRPVPTLEAQGHDKSNNGNKHGILVITRSDTHCPIAYTLDLHKHSGYKVATNLTMEICKEYLSSHTQTRIAPLLTPSTRPPTRPTTQGARLWQI